MKISNLEAYMKADLTQSMVVRLFRLMGFYVKYNGVEVAHPEFVYFRKLGNLDGEEVKKLYSQPDLIVSKLKDEIHPKGLSRKVEVKFRKDGKLTHKDIIRYDEDTHFILVDKENFWSVSKAAFFSIEGNQSVIFKKSLKALADCNEFNLNAEQIKIIDLYKPFLQSFLC